MKHLYRFPDDSRHNSLKCTALSPVSVCGFVAVVCLFFKGKSAILEIFFFFLPRI